MVISHGIDYKILSIYILTKLTLCCISSGICLRLYSDRGSV